ncbi:glycosyltransferase family 2 protein [Marinobacter sp. M-5]|uniref:glycosyltransferase family 2 protein n=1 Tax=Marinobacter sp. M-5 TaxID=3081089 RepID=UPI00293C203B|nr:glycosyltransferase family 2 protein [Marinobacter sp. M-5]MDV3503071.1 glycosyltransferase family 2 protein [Marinobacter sp. M-5]
MKVSGSIDVILPAKNEAGTIQQVVSELVKIGFVNEVLVIDDGSSDDTATKAKLAGARVICHPYSKGNGAAIKTGILSARSELIVMMDADGQHSPSDIKTLFSHLESGGYDMVVGARSKSGQANYHRHLANEIYNFLASKITEQKILDLTSGFRIVKRLKALEFLELLPNKFSYPTTLTMAFFRAGYSVGYYPISVKKRTGKSHLNPIKDGIRFLLIIFKVATLYSPLKVFFPISISFLLMGSVYAIYTLIEMGRFTNMSALLLTTGVIIFLIGLISEQVTSLIYISLGRKRE